MLKRKHIFLLIYDRKTVVHKKLLAKIIIKNRKLLGYGKPPNAAALSTAFKFCLLKQNDKILCNMQPIA